MRYPIYPTQITSGNLPSMADMGPPDLRPSSSTAPFYQGRFDRMHGRHLAGIGSVQDEAVDQGYALNELRLMEHMDDNQASGIFDAYGTGRNVHPDAGIFADHYALPGFVARERSFAPSEVLDATTGAPVRYVPAGWMNPGDRERLAYVQGVQVNQVRPVTGMVRPMPGVDTSVATLSARSVQGLGELSSTGRLVALAAGAVGVGALVYLLTKKG